MLPPLAKSKYVHEILTFHSFYSKKNFPSSNTNLDVYYFFKCKIKIVYSFLDSLKMNFYKISSILIILLIINVINHQLDYFLYL